MWKMRLCRLPVMSTKVREREGKKHASEVLNIQHKDAAISLKGKQRKHGFNFRPKAGIAFEY